MLSAALDGSRALRLVLLALALIGLAVLLPVLARAAPFSPPAVDGDAPAHLRGAPWGAIVGDAAPGSSLAVLDAECDERGRPWLRVSAAGGKSGWIFGDLVELRDGFAAEVVVGPLRTRVAPWSGPRDALGQGAWVRVVEVVCDDDLAPWYRLRDGSWAFAGFLRPEGGSDPAALDGVALAAVAAERGVGLRAVPGGPPTDTLAPGRAAVVLNSQREPDGRWWHLVAYGRKQGWVGEDRLTLGPLHASAARSLAARVQPGAYAVLYAFEGERLVRVMPARSGGPADPTPRGDFRVLERSGTIRTTIYRRRIGHEWILPHFVQFQGDYGIHGPMMDERTERAVDEATAGCLMPSAEDAAWLFGWLQVGDPISIR